MRFVIGFIGLILTLIFAVWLVIAVDSQGRISKDEFYPVALGFGIVSLLICIWVVRNGDAEDAKDSRL